MKRAVAFLLLAAVAAAAAGFAVQNPQSIELAYYLGWRWRGPLAWALLVALALGALLGYLVALPPRFRERRRALRAEASLSRVQQEAVQRRSASGESAPE